MNLLNSLFFLGQVGMGELIVLFFFIALPLIALIDILRSEFTNYNKLIWLLVIIFLSILGVLLYFIIGRKQKIK